MTTIALTAAPACARQVWCDFTYIYVELPHKEGGAPFIMKFENTPKGLSQALELLRDARDKHLPKGGSYSLLKHPKTKEIVARPDNPLTAGILKKLGMI